MITPADDPAPVGRFVHLDALTADSPWSSPSTPEQYIQALARQYPDAGPIARSEVYLRRLAGPAAGAPLD
jgi:hypothetical protein